MAIQQETVNVNRHHVFLKGINSRKSMIMNDFYNSFVPFGIGGVILVVLSLTPLWQRRNPSAVAAQTALVTLLSAIICAASFSYMRNETTAFITAILVSAAVTAVMGGVIYLFDKRILKESKNVIRGVISFAVLSTIWGAVPIILMVLLMILEAMTNPYMFH